MFFNICFASVPILIYGLLEQPFSMNTLMRNPHLYVKNKKNSLMTVRKFIPWLLSGFWHAVVVYYMTYFAWKNFDRMNDISTFGTIVFSGVVITSNLKVN